MRYLLLAYGEQEKMARLTEAELADLMEKCCRYDGELQATGKVVGSGSLSWSSKTLRPRGGKLVVTDGPFVDTKEVVGGVVMIEADDFEEAVRVASLHPAARVGEEYGWGIELRPMDNCMLALDPNETTA